MVLMVLMVFVVLMVLMVPGVLKGKLAQTFFDLLLVCL